MVGARALLAGGLRRTGLGTAGLRAVEPRVVTGPDGRVAAVANGTPRATPSTPVSARRRRAHRHHRRAGAGAAGRGLRGGPGSAAPSPRACRRTPARGAVAVRESRHAARLGVGAPGGPARLTASGDPAGRGWAAGSWMGFPAWARCSRDATSCWTPSPRVTWARSGGCTTARPATSGGQDAAPGGRRCCCASCVSSPCGSTTPTW